MYSRIVLNIVFIICINCLSCTKDETTTIITGTITEEVHNQALEHVSTWLIAHDYETENSYSDTSFTNFNGEYYLNVVGYNVNDAKMYLYKPGYVSLEYDILPGTTLTKNIKLSPLDSHITFKIANKLGKTNTMHGTYWSSVLYYQFMSAFKDPIPVPMGTVYKETRLIPGNTYIYISWDYSSYPSDKYFPHLDSIFVPRGDTVTYNITI